MRTALFIVENKRKEQLFRETFPDAEFCNLSHDFQQAYWLVRSHHNGTASPKQLFHHQRNENQIQNLRLRAAPFSLIYLAFDPDHEDLAAACTLALRPLRKTAQIVRLRPNALNPSALKGLLSEPHKCIEDKHSPFSSLESQRVMARKLLHIETARRLKKIANNGLNPLTLAQALLLEIIYKHEQQDKGSGGLLESWREISLEIRLSDDQSECLAADLIVPDKAIAYGEQNPERKQIWEHLSILGKQTRKKNRVHEEFHQMQQAEANGPWRFPDLEEAYQAAQQLQANPRLVLSIAYNEPALEKIKPPHHTASLYQSSGSLIQYLNYLHQVLHEDLYQNGLITYPETTSSRFPDQSYYSLFTYRTLLKSKTILVHRPFEDPRNDRGQIAILPTQWTIDTAEKLRNYLAARNESYTRKASHFQIVWEIYHDIYKRALASQTDFSHQTTDHFYLIGPADPSYPSGINPHASHDHWIFLGKKEGSANTSFLKKHSFRSGQIFELTRPAVRRIKQIKPPAEVSNLLRITKQWEICSPPQLHKHLSHLIKEELLKSIEQQVTDGSIHIYQLTEKGKSYLKTYKELVPTAVNLSNYRRFHRKLRNIISPEEAKQLLDIWLERLEKEIMPQSRIRREPDAQNLKRIAAD